MNKVTRIFYFTFLLFAVSCSFADEELFVEQSQVDNTNHAAKPPRLRRSLKDAYSMTNITINRFNNSTDQQNIQFVTP